MKRLVVDGTVLLLTVKLGLGWMKDDPIAKALKNMVQVNFILILNDIVL